MLTEQMINETKISNVTLDDLKATIQFNTGLGDVIKWQLVGLYIKNDDLEIEQLESLFAKNGAFHEQRYFKTQAQYVFKALSNDKEIEGKKHKLSDIANMSLDERPFSIGVAYKNRPKAEPRPKDERREAAKTLIKDNEMKGQTPEKILSLIDQGFMDESILQNAIMKNRVEAISKEFPEFTTDNLEKIVTMTKEYLTEMFTNHPQEFEAITDHILDLQSTPAQDAVAEAA